MEDYPPQEIFDARAEIAKALAHPARLKIIDVLNREGDKCVCEFTEMVELSQSSVSKHLKILRSAGIISSETRGVRTYYSLQMPCVINFFSCMDEVLREDLSRKDLGSYLDALRE